MSKTVGKYILVNDEKLKRALEGSLTRNGKLDGGLQGKPEWAGASEEEKGISLLAEYDRLGGLILKDNLKVKLGTFYDFDLKEPRKDIDESFIINLDGDIVEVDEDEAKAIVSAREKVAKIKNKGKVEKKEKKKRKFKAENIEE